MATRLNSDVFLIIGFGMLARPSSLAWDYVCSRVYAALIAVATD